MAYMEGPDYVPLLRKSFELYRQLEQETGQVGSCTQTTTPLHPSAVCASANFPPDCADTDQPDIVARRKHDSLKQLILILLNFMNLQKLYWQTGCINIGDPVFSAARATAEHYQLPHEALTAQQAQDRWPGVGIVLT